MTLSIRPATVRPPNFVAPGWLRAVQLAAVPGPIIFWVLIFRLSANANGLFLPPGCLSFVPPIQTNLMGMVLSLFVGVPYLHVIGRLLGRNHEKGLRLAIFTGIGGIVILPAALVLAGPAANPTESWQWRGAAGIVLSQALLTFLAVKAYFTMEAGARRLKDLAFGAIPPAIYFLVSVPILFISNTLLFPPRQPKPADESAVVVFMSFRVMELTYAATHLSSYMPDLRSAGPMGQPQLKGYQFTYQAGLPGVDGIIKSYTLLARPMEPCPGRCSCSYFMDQTGVLRMTKENHPATVDDLPLTPDERIGRGVGPQM